MSIEKIEDAVRAVVRKYSVRKVSLFGSYADGNATDDSDIDLLIEFNQDTVSLLHIINLKYELEDMLGLSVDVIHAPVPAGALICPEKVIEIYEAA
jgi:predicted nucleotidyltransferase